MKTMRVLKFMSTEYKIPKDITSAELGEFLTTFTKLLPISHAGNIVEEGYRTEIAISTQLDPNSQELESEPKEETE